MAPKLLFLTFLVFLSSSQAQNVLDVMNGKSVDEVMAILIDLCRFAYW
jgi:hypothetical protein